MRNGFYFKLAASNLKRNAKTYFPYLITCVVSIMMYEMVCALGQNPQLATMAAGDSMQSLLGFGSFIVAVFSVVFLIYTYRFLMGRRQLEFGMFNILGMEKRHIARIMVYESLLTLLVSLTCGLLLGMALNKVMFLVIVKLLNGTVQFGFDFSFSAVVSTILLFTFIFFVNYLNALRVVHLASPVELLHRSHYGQKEPKSKWLMTLIGIVCLGIGYYISLTTTNPLGAFGMFCIAVLLVMLGTYLLFTAGSITLLQFLKHRKKYYYQTSHFISISGLLYRMKQNAAGLSNICILSTMVLVILSTTCSLWFGIEDSLYRRYPSEFVLTMNDDELTDARLAVVDDILAGEHLSVDKTTYHYLAFTGMLDGSHFVTDRSEFSMNQISRIYNLFLVDLKDYNAAMGTNAYLADNEILLYCNRGHYGPDTLDISDYHFIVKEKLDHFIDNGNAAADIATTLFIVVPDQSIIDALYTYQLTAYGENASQIQFYEGFDTQLDDEANLALYDKLTAALGDSEGDIVESRTQSRQSYISLYGGLLFIGIFLSVLFIMATIIIIYYKQITEGMEDRDHYIIMQKVGMDQSMVKKAIHSQILTVFFLPLVVALIHLLFAFPIIKGLLLLFSFSNTTLYLQCALICFVIFALAYTGIYALTSKTYYHIVKMN